MKASIVFAMAFGCLLAMPAVQAQQASAPAGSTGQCKDGSYTSIAKKRSSCRGHKGVKEWYAASGKAKPPRRRLHRRRLPPRRRRLLLDHWKSR